MCLGVLVGGGRSGEFLTTLGLFNIGCVLDPLVYGRFMVLVPARDSTR